MTALAMVLGMLPMALALGEGGEQNAPLGRAVIGGLLVATFVTLFIVPVVYSVLRRKEPAGAPAGRAFPGGEPGRTPWSAGMSEIHAVKPPLPDSRSRPRPTAPAQPRPRALTIGTIVLVLAAVVGVVALALGRRGAEAKERQAARRRCRTAGPWFGWPRWSSPTPSAPSASPARCAPGTRPRCTRRWPGYVREVLVDKGSRVKKGDLLARLESPETDQQVLGARADLQLKTVQAERARKLRPQGFIAQQDLDNAESALSVSRATLQQLLALQAYEQVRAPFDGVVTARYVDPGCAGRRGHRVEPGGAAALRLRGHADGARPDLRRPGRRGGHPSRKRR